MNAIEGFIDEKPQVEKISFSLRGKMNVHFEDGRVVIVPIARFPAIKKLTRQQRQHWQSLGEGFTFDDCTEVYHIEQVLGSYSSYRHGSE